jgi:FixJ family two-component response regulator
VLRSAGHRVETFETARAFLDQDVAEGPACAVVDLGLPDLSGPELQRVLNRPERPVPVIFLTGDGDVALLVQAMKAGAIEVLIKPIESDRLLAAVREALERDGREQAERRVLAELRRRYATLTPRQREVMAHVVEGRLNREIAAILGTSEITVKLHRAKLMLRMQVKNAAELIHAANRLASKLRARRLTPKP